MNKSLRKLFSLALALALVFSSGLGVGNITAQAEETTNTEFTDIANLTDAEKANIEFVVEREIMTGYEDDTFRPNGTLTRRHAAMVLARALDLELKDYEGTFEDVKENLGGKEIEALVRAGIVDGYPDRMFRPNAPLQRVHFAKLVANAYELEMGDKEVTHTDLDNLGTDKAFVELVLSNGIVDGYPDGTFGPRNEVKRIHVTKFMKNTIEFVEAPVVEELTVESVSAIGAKKLAVEFNKAVEEGAFQVKKGSITVNVKEVIFAEDNKSAVIELSTKLTKGDYTIAFDGATSTITVENEKVAEIQFLSEAAVLQPTSVASETDMTLQTTYKVLNQYGEDITATASGITFTTGKGVVTPNAANGTLKIDNIGSVAPKTNTAYAVNDKVAVTAIHATTGTFASTVLTVSNKSRVAEINIVSLYEAGNKELNVNSTPGDFKLVIDAKDQYGNMVAAGNIAEDVIVSVSNPAVANIATTGVAPNTVPTFATTPIDGKNKTTIALAGPLTAGTSSVTMISKTTGHITKFDITVVAAAKVDELSVSTPAIAVAGEKIVIPFTAVDQFGKEMTKATALNAGVNSKTATVGVTTYPVAWVQDHVKNVANLEINTSGMAAEGTLVLTVVTGTNKVVQLPISVVKPATASVITELKDVVTTVAETGVINLETKHIVVKDNYGRDITPTYGTAAGNYRIALETSDVAKVSLGATNFHTGSVALNGVEKGSSTITLTLQNNNAGNWEDVTNSEFTFTAKVVQKAEITSYEVADIDKLLVKAFGTDTHEVDLEVTGILANGTKVAVPASYYNVTINEVGVTHNSATGTLHADVALVTFPAGPPAATEITVPVIVTINAAGAPVFVKNVVVTNVAPKIETLALKASAGNITKEAADVISIDVAKADTQAEIDAEAINAVEAKDQYGKTITTAFSNVIVTNLPTGKVLGGSGKAALVAGDFYDVTAITDNGKIITFKVILK